MLLDFGSSSAPTPILSNPLSCDAYSLVAADLNNDKKLDLIAVCSNYVVVMLGKGDGTFQPPVYSAVTSGSSLIVVMDLNGDGYPDIAVAGASTISVLLNQGSGNPGVLSNPVTYSIPEGTLLYSVESGDFNGDGKQDVVVCENVTSSESSQLVVLYGNGDGTLQAAQASSPCGPFTVGDFNEDGIADIAYTSVGDGNIGEASTDVLLGSSSGFTAGASVQLSGSGYQAPIEVKNQISGHIDLAMVGDSTTILLGNGGGGFTVGPSYAYGDNFGNLALPEVEADGKTNLIYSISSNSDLTVLTANGDGPYQGIPTLPLGFTPAAAIAGIAPADVNGDGLTDIVYVDGKGNLGSAMGRGNGTFLPISSSTTGAIAGFLTVGDFNGDGKADTIAISYPQNISGGVIAQQDAQLSFYAGNGDGTFQAGTPVFDLQAIGAAYAVSGDFNGDGKLDLIVSFYNPNAYTASISFIPGNGDGTFGTPVSLTQIGSMGPPIAVLVADLNNDHKLDLIWGATVFLGNGDGTFQQQPLGSLGANGGPFAAGDLNGDGFPDLVVGNSVYAGNGDGTFQTTPLYTAANVTSNSVTGASIGDVNGDGAPDLLLQTESQVAPNQVFAFLGDGHGAFTADSNLYYDGDALEGATHSNNAGGNLGNQPPMGLLTRLNNSAPTLAADHALDYLVFTDGATVLLNQMNPAPAALAAYSSKVVLASSASSATPGQQLTLTAAVTGISPTGSVSFFAGGSNLGAANVVNGAATLPISFATAGTHSVTASYSGDSNNIASVSSAVSLTIGQAASTVTLTASATSANEKQSITLTATVSGYNPIGNVAFSASNTALGSAALNNGIATLQYAFPAAGSYSVIAAYSGDTNNVASSSNTVAITVVAPDFTIAASPASATISPGQSATTTLTITPVGGYSGTVQLACGTLPSEVSCTFSPSSVSIAGSPVTSTLTISTTAATASIRDITGSLSKTAWAGLLCFLLSYRRIRNANRKLMTTAIAAVVLFSGFVFLTACGGESHSTTTTNPGTPAGADTVTVTLTDSASGTSHTVPFQLTIQ